MVWGFITCRDGREKIRGQGKKLREVAERGKGAREERGVEREVGMAR